MPFVQGGDMPDRLWATNATIPPLNEWCRLNPEQLKQFEATDAAIARAKEVAEGREARKRARVLKHRLFEAIAQVSFERTRWSMFSGGGGVHNVKSIYILRPMPTASAKALANTPSCHATQPCPPPCMLQHDLEASRQLLRSTALLERHTPYGATPLCLAAAVGGARLQQQPHFAHMYLCSTSSFRGYGLWPVTPCADDDTCVPFPCGTGPQMCPSARFCSRWVQARPQLMG